MHVEVPAPGAVIGRRLAVIADDARGRRLRGRRGGGDGDGGFGGQCVGLHAPYTEPAPAGCTRRGSISPVPLDKVADMTDGWTGEAGALLARAVARHGGRDAWEALRCVTLAPKNLSGLLPSLKGVGRTFPLPPRVDIYPHEYRAVFHDYPAPGQHGVFAAGAVQLVDAGGRVVAADADPRARFRGPRKWRRWSPADALYFFGYALTHYHGLPFTLADGRPLALCRARSDGRALTGVDVELPAALHTHSRRQTFYFDDEGLLRRHDYVAEIVGWWARGAHLWRDFVTAHGIPIPRERHVVARLGRTTTPFVALHADLDVVDA